ncbi:MAG: hypothetical protein H7840_12265 [Alphaproteobacteria bacterium]
MAVGSGTVAKAAVVAGSGQAVCVAKGLGTSVLLGAGAWGVVVLGVLATVATYEFLTNESQHAGTGKAAAKARSRSILDTLRSAVTGG